MATARKTFVIEHCENCQMHSWCTRHDANSYKQHAINLATAIKEAVPDAEVTFNMVPKLHAMSEIYCQLIPNSDPNQPYYEIMPRIGSFEVSCNGVVSKSINSLIICK